MSGSDEYYRRNYVRFLPSDRQAPILDIGCGQGDFVRFLSDLGYQKIIAIDRDPPAIAALEGQSGVTASRLEIDPDNLPTHKGGWALIVAKQMIYYFDRGEAPAFVRSLAGALAPDGRLIVEIFNGGLMSGQFTQAKDPGIRTAYSELGLSRLLQQNGLIVDHIGAAILPRCGLKGRLYAFAQALWFRLYRVLLVVERGHDDELPRIGCKTIIAVAHRR